MNAANRFGVIVVGDEILNGKRIDKHVPHVIDVLQSRGLQLAWFKVVSDEKKRLKHEFDMTQQDTVPVFSFGGIGATPDDQTRQAVAEAFGVPLVRHPDAVSLIENQFGNSAYPNRILMADLPEDCLLIPNPHNQIPGFTLYNHHFFPGFPSMAWPMMEWVLDHYYPGVQLPEQEHAVKVFGAHESELIMMMEKISKQHSQVKLFSLPHMGATNYIELGFRGEKFKVESAFETLLMALSAEGLYFESCDSDCRRLLVNQAI